MRGILSKISCVIILVMLISFTGCTSSSDRDSSSRPENLNANKIVIWAFDQYITAAHEAVQLYQRDNPEVEFEVIELSQDDLVQKFRIALASGTSDSLPDIIIEEDYNMKGYLHYYQDSFVELTPYLDASNYMDFKLENSIYNNELYALPYDSGTSALFYRLDILEQAGYTSADLENITWDEFIVIGQDVKEKTGTYMLPISPEGNIEGRIMLQSTGQWYYDLEGKLNIENNTALVDMMKTLGSLFDSGIVYRVSAWDDIISSFYNGSVACVVGGSWWAPIIADNPEQSGLWRMTSIPRMSGNSEYTNYSNIGGCGWMVINKSQADKAIDFLVSTFATDKELINTLVEKTQLVTVRKDAIHVPNALKGDPYFGNQNLCETMAVWGENIPSVNYSLHSYEIAYAHGELMTDYLDGLKTEQDILDELQIIAEEIVSSDTL